MPYHMKDKENKEKPMRKKKKGKKEKEDLKNRAEVIKAMKEKTFKKLNKSLRRL